MWQHIQKLKGEKQKREDKLRVYGEDAKELKGTKLKEEAFWSTIYKKHNNKIHKVWNSVKKEEYEHEYEVTKRDISVGKTIKIEDEHITGEEGRIEHISACSLMHREHYEMAFRMRTGISNIQEEIISEDRVMKCLRKMKNKKAAGPDGIRPELYKVLGENKQLRDDIIRCLSEVVETGNIPKGWQESTTVMIPKVNKPKPNELRPIALTNVGYKLMMGIIREYIEEHIQKNEMGKDTQA